MRYWWVNQNQTYRHDIGGGYLWSPKRNANGVFKYMLHALDLTTGADKAGSPIDMGLDASGQPLAVTGSWITVLPIPVRLVPVAKVAGAPFSSSF